MFLVQSVVLSPWLRLCPAHENGQRTANGVSMVVGQAAEAFQMFTIYAPDREQMLSRLLSEIESERLQHGLAA